MLLRLEHIRQIKSGVIVAPEGLVPGLFSGSLCLSFLSFVSACIYKNNTRCVDLSVCVCVDRLVYQSLFFDEIPRLKDIGAEDLRRCKAALQFELEQLRRKHDIEMAAAYHREARRVSGFRFAVFCQEALKAELGQVREQLEALRTNARERALAAEQAAGQVREQLEALTNARERALAAEQAALESGAPSLADRCDVSASSSCEAPAFAASCEDPGDAAWSLLDENSQLNWPPSRTVAAVRASLSALEEMDD